MNLSSDHFYGPKAIDVTHGDPKYKVKSNYKFPPGDNSSPISQDLSLVNIFGSDVISKTYSYVPDKSLGLGTTTYEINSNYSPSQDNKLLNTVGSDVTSTTYSYVPDKSLGLGTTTYEINSNYSPSPDN